MSNWKSYINYLHNWANEHSDEEFSGMSPVCYDEFLFNDLNSCQECGSEEPAYTIAEWCEQLDLYDHIDQLYNIAENLGMKSTDICLECFNKLIKDLCKDDEENV